MTKPIRVLEIAAKYVDNCDISCMRVFEDVSRDPPGAKALKGSIVLDFVNFKGKTTLWDTIPENRAFIRRLDEKYPFFLYFLLPAKELRLIRHYLLCLLPGKAVQTSGSGWGIEILPIDLFELLRRKTDTLIEYCQLVADDPHETVRALIDGAPNPENILEPLHKLADDPTKLRTLLASLLPPPKQVDAWENIKRDLRYWSFKQAMDNDPFVRSKDGEARYNVAVVRQLVLHDMESARRWFNDYIQIAQSMSRASSAKTLAAILIIVAGFLEEQGDSRPMQLWKARYGRPR